VRTHRTALPHRPTQRGITLYEVILALAILLPALVVITQGIATATRAAVTSRLRTEAIFRCDSIVSEVAAGARPIGGVSRSAAEDGAPGWWWSMELLGGPHPDTLQVSVTVEHEDSTGAVNASWTLNRLIRDPQLFLDAAAMAGSTSAADSTGTTGTGTGTSTGAPTSGASTGGTR
jgi:general secretion pathway protein I